MFSYSDYQAVLITDEKQIFYFCGYKAEGYLVITPTQKFCVTDLRYYADCEKACRQRGFKAVIGCDFSFLAQIVKAEKIKRLGIDYNAVSYSKLREIKRACSCVADVSGEISAFLVKKSENELACIKKACEITEKTFLEVLPLIREGMTELELCSEIVYRFLKYGASGTSFEPIVAFGKNSALPHHVTSGDKLEKNQPVLMDIGCVYNGYASDFTRTVFFGDPTPKFIYAYNAVNEAFDNAFSGITDKMLAGEADKLARDVLDQAGLKFIHSLGHGVGLNIHESPYLRKGGKEIIENGCVFTIEPGAYIDGEFGIRTEDTCYLKDGKVCDFFTVDRRLKIIGDKINNY